LKFDYFEWPKEYTTITIVAFIFKIQGNLLRIEFLKYDLPTTKQLGRDYSTIASTRVYQVALERPTK